MGVHRRGQVFRATRRRTACDLFDAVKSLIFSQMGDVIGGLNLADQIIEESQQIGDLFIIIDAFVVKGSALYELGELNTCLEVIKTAENILDAVKLKDQLEYIKRESKLEKSRVAWYKPPLGRLLSDLNTLAR